MTEGQETGKTEISGTMGETEILCRLLEVWPALLPHEQAALGSLLTKSPTWDIATIFAHVSKNPLSDKSITLCQAILNMASKRLKQEDENKGTKVDKTKGHGNKNKADKTSKTKGHNGKTKVGKTKGLSGKEKSQCGPTDKVDKCHYDLQYSKNPHLRKPRVILINPFRNEE